MGNNFDNMSEAQIRSMMDRTAEDMLKTERFLRFLVKDESQPILANRQPDLTGSFLFLLSVMAIRNVELCFELGRKQGMEDAKIEEILSPNGDHKE